MTDGTSKTDKRGDPGKTAGDANAPELVVLAAELRDAFDRLAATIGDDRAVAASQFRDAVGSLAAELRDREAALEYLALEVRKRDQMISTQHATIAELQKRVEETAVHARNMEAEARIVADRERQQIQGLETRILETETHVRNLEAALAGVEARARIAEEAYEKLLSSRGGRALKRYANTKRALLGRKD
jgi:hypothetical protein